MSMIGRRVRIGAEKSETSGASISGPALNRESLARHAPQASAYRAYRANSRILLIEEEAGLIASVSELLGAEGYRVETAFDGELGLSRGSTGDFDLVIVDLATPKKPGLDICRELRERGVDSAILMLTAQARQADGVLGLRLGADDYLSKPFDLAELSARVAALLRRVQKENRIPVKSFHFGDVEIDFEQAEARKAGQRVSLAAKEWQLLRYLVDHRERTVGRQEILRNVWAYSSEVSSRTIDVHVAWLRQKLEDRPQNPRYIQTIRGKGYLFRA